MQTIWKYTLEVTDEQTVQLPEGAQILSIQPQGPFGEGGGGEVELWALVDPETPIMIDRIIHIHGTGHPIKDEDIDLLTHISTFQLMGGQLVFHAFEGIDFEVDSDASDFA